MIQGQVRVDLLLDSLACWVLLSIFLFSVCFGLRSSHSNVLLDECCYQQCQRGVAPYDTWIDASCDKDLDAEFIFYHWIEKKTPMPGDQTCPTPTPTCKSLILWLRMICLLDSSDATKMLLRSLR